MSNTENAELATGALSHLSVELGTTSNECTHEPMLIYTNPVNNSLVEEPICRRCGHKIKFSNAKGCYVLAA
jgi:hypothetical protein